MATDIIKSGFEPTVKNDSELMQVSESRAVAEVQAAFVIAKKFPRDEHASYINIMKSCERPSLAEQAMYAYPKGGQVVKGPSIRLAETLAQKWGNVDFGIKEVSQSDGVSVCEAYAIDLETNVRITKVFHVPHFRDTKQGKKRLTDSRDIYELVANQGSRRLRACILGVIPGDVIDAAVDRCDKTLQSSDIPIADRIRKLVLAFNEFGISPEHLEKRLGHKLEATIPQEIVTLGSIYKSLKDGMADRSQFFDIGAQFKKNDETLDELKSVLRSPAPEPLVAIVPLAVHKSGRDDVSASPEQLTKIEELFREKNIDAKKRKKILDDLNVDDLINLSEAQAIVILMQLEK
jgi:hypothetical protein